MQPWHTPFPIWNQSVVPCPVLTVASWPAYRFLKRQVRWTGIPISFRIFQSTGIHTVKGFGIINKAKVDVFLELSCFSDDPADVGNLISGSSAFSKTTLNILHIHNETVHNYKKECIWVGSNEVDEPEAYHTEWSESERERQISCINVYMWDTERWYWWTCLQCSNGDADRENRLLDTVKQRDGRMIWESSTETYISPHVKQRASGNLLYDLEPKAHAL